MSVENLAQALPAYAKDIKLNLSGVLRQEELTDAQKWGSVVTASLTSGAGSSYLAGVLEEAATHLTAEQLEGARIAAAIMAMNNVYYRFGHLSSNEKYLQSPARLRMNGIRQHGADQKDFELWSLVASAINGCGLCIDSHERVLREHGIDEETILAVVRIGSVFRAAFEIVRWESSAG